MIESFWLRGLLGGDGGFDDAHDIALGHDQQILAVELDLGAGPLAEQDAVAPLDAERHQGALLVAGAGADGDDLALHRLFLGGVGDDDATLARSSLVNASNHDVVVQRPELHGDSFGLPYGWLRVPGLRMQARPAPHFEHGDPQGGIKRAGRIYYGSGHRPEL